MSAHDHPPDAPAPSPAPSRPTLLAAYRGEGLAPTVRALGVASFFQDVASEMVYPLLPLFLASLGGGPVALGAMESIAEGVLAFVKGAVGRWSDRVRRRKPFVVAGYLLSALARPVMAVVASVPGVVATRTADRVAKGLRTAPRDALIAETTEPARRGYAFSFHRGLDHLGAAVGPLVAALVLLAAPGSLRLVFALATVPALVGVATVALRARESIPGGEARASEPAAAPVAAAPTAPESGGIPRALRLPLAGFVLFALGNASDAFLLLRAGELGVTPLGLTLLWSLFHVAKWLSSVPGGRLADRWGARRSLLAGWALYAAAYLGFAVAATPWLPFLLLAYAVHFGLTEGAERKLVVELAGRALGAGSSLGAYHFASGIGSFASSLLFGILWQRFGPMAAFGFGAAMAAMAAALVAVARAAPPPGRATA